MATRRIEIDASKPSRTVMAGGMGGGNTSQYEIVVGAKHRGIVKPPYRVPSMGEIQAAPRNGYSVASLFSGCGGSCLGFEIAGFKVLWANEFEPNAAECHRLNFPDCILDTRDVRTVKPEEILKATETKPGEIDLLDASPPCFEAGTPIVTARGIVPIETIAREDVVLTHKNRWRRVVSIMTRNAPTIVVDGRIRTTSDHLFLARMPGRTWDNSRRICRRTLTVPVWEYAAEIRGKFCATPTAVEPVDIPFAPEGFVYNEGFWYVVGRWLGDGWFRIFAGNPALLNVDRPKQNRSPVACRRCGQPSAKNSRLADWYTNYCGAVCSRKYKQKRRRRPRYEVIICTSHGDAKNLKMAMSKLGCPVGTQYARTVARLSISRKSFTIWLKTWFGSGAANKTMPGWALGMPSEWRASLLRGYRDADGDSPTTISRCLASAVALLANTLGFTVGIDGPYLNKKNTIEGRTVNIRPQYRIGIFPDDRRYTEIDGTLSHRWRKIRRPVRKGSDYTSVYDIEVEEDHSFIADTLVVHNCQPFSTAGKRHKRWGAVTAHADGTMQRSDDLFFEFARILRGLRPRTFVAENVSGLVKGVCKGYFKLILADLKSCGYLVEARLLDAQWLGVPQQRQRIFFVGVRADLAEKFGVSPAFPEPLPYRYSALDAIGDLLGMPEKPAARVLVRYGSGFRGESFRDGSQYPAQTIGASPSSGNNFNGGASSIRFMEETGGKFGKGQFIGPAPTVRASGGGHLKIEMEADISRYAIGEEWGKLKPGEQSGRYFNLVRADPRRPSPAILASHGNPSTAGVTHFSEKRKFTIAELKRICGFPDDFILVGSYMKQWARLGNSVPPPVMFRIAETIREKILDVAYGYYKQEAPQRGDV